jgi:hypothetical protein
MFIRATIIVMLFSGSVFGFWKSTKTGVIHTETCSYATTSTVRYETWAAVLLSGKSLCKVCKPVDNTVFDINSPVFGTTQAELQTSVIKHIEAGEKMLPTATNKRALIDQLLVWHLIRMRYISGEPNVTPIRLTQSANQITMSWEGM